MSAAPLVITSLTYQIVQTSTASVSVLFRFSLAGGKPPFTIVWDFGDGTTLSGILGPMNPGSISSTLKDYAPSAFQSPPMAKLTITDGLGQAASQSVSLSVPSGPPGVQPQVLLNFKVLQVVGGTARVQFTGTVIGLPLAYPNLRWDFGDGTIPVTAPFGVTHDYPVGPKGGSFMALAIATSPLVVPGTNTPQQAAGSLTVNVSPMGGGSTTLIVLASVAIAAAVGGYYLLSRRG